MKLKEETEKIKKELSIVDIALNNGFEMVKKKSSKNTKVLDNGIDKIIVSKNISNKHYIFFSVEDGKGGSVIDFYKKYINDKKQFWQIIKDLKKYMKVGEIKYKLEATEKDEIETKKEILRLRPIEKANRFLKERKIEDKTVKAFYPYVVEDYRKNTSFILQSFNKIEEKLKIEDIGIDKRNTDYKNVTGEKGLWGKNIEKEKDFYIFESPLDAMAFYQLYKKKGNYISTGGNLSEKEIKSLKSLYKHIKPHNVNICYDNDTGGKILADRLKSVFSLSDNPERVINIIKPKNKDFNEDLINTLKEKEERIRKQRNRHIRRR